MPRAKLCAECGHPNFREAHKLTWAAIRDHAQHAISPNGYHNATDEQRAALDAEDERNFAAERIIRARVRAVALALLPLHDAWPDEEPADLIEWAERLS